MVAAGQASRSRGGAAAMLVVGVALAAGAALLARPHLTPTVIVPSEIEFGELLLGETVRRDIEVRNTSLLRRAVVTRVNSSCGCTVAAWESSVPAAGSATIAVEVHPSMYDPTVESTLHVFVGDYDRLKSVVTARVVRPFEGWPSRAVGRMEQDGSGLVVDIDPRYSAAELGARCFVGTTEVGVLVESQGNRLIVAAPPDGVSVTLVASFGEDYWQGPVAMIGAARAPSSGSD